MNPSAEDRLLQRYLDGELSAAESAAFAARMLSDTGLRERVQVAEAQRDVVRGGLAREVAAPAGFTASVMAEVRRLPSREQLQRIDLVDGALQTCRRILLAATVLFGLGLAWHIGLFDRNRADTVEAAPNEVQQEMDRLDALILQGGVAEVPRRGK